MFRYTLRTNALKAGTYAGFAMVLLAVTGCGYDGIEFKGKLFDAVGMNGSSDKKAVKMKPRAGLVTPPSLERLPAPGSEKDPGSDSLASIADPDRISAEAPAELARRQREYCKKHYDPAVARGDDTAASIEGPAGTCRKTVWNSIGQGNDSPE